eukprot:scaffold127356_cov21-Tisochrysis_lutea.AAC.1
MSATCLVDSHGGIIGLEGVREEDSFESESRWLPAYGEEKGAIKQQQQDKDHHHQQQQQQPPRKAQRQASLDRQVAGPRGCHAGAAHCIQAEPLKAFTLLIHLLVKNNGLAHPMKRACLPGGKAFKEALARTHTRVD